MLKVALNLPTLRQSCQPFRMASFTHRVKNTWNSLPDFVVSDNNTNTFKCLFNNFVKNQDIIHNFKTQIHVTGSQRKCEV